MATLIDSLVVGLGLDARAFEAGRKQVGKAFKDTGEDARKQAAQIEAHGKQAALFFTRLRNEALTFFAVFTAGAGLKNFISDTITGTAALGRQAANLRLSTRELSAWQRANERAGGTAQGITTQLQEANSEVAKYASGLTPANISAFAKYGGDFSAYRSGTAYLMERARIVSTLYAKSPERAALAAQELGIQEDTYNLIKQGPQAIQALIAAQAKNTVVTEKDAEEAERLRIKLLDLRDTLQATATRILLTLAPVMEDLLKRLQKLADWIAEHREDIAQWVSAAVEGLGRFVVGVDAAVEAMGGWKVVLAALIALKVTSLVSQFLALAGAISSVGKSAAGVSAGAAAGTGFWGLLRSMGVGVAAATYSGSLNEGEEADLARRRAMGATIDSGETLEQFRNRVGASAGGADQAMDSLMGKGWTREQAAGIVANLKQESNFDPGARGDGGKAYGIAQWHPDRQAAFKKQFGKDIQGSTFEEQLTFLDWEMREGREKAAGDRLKRATNAAEAGHVVSKYYERPADEVGEASRRSRMALGYDAAERARAAKWKADNPETQADIARAAQLSADAAEGARSAGSGRGFINPSTSTSSSEVNIGAITVQTQATDAAGIARDIGPAIQKNGLVAQANAGLS